MKRKSIQSPRELSMAYLYLLTEDLTKKSVIGFGTVSGAEKMDGIFMSIGVDDQDEFWFQTSNSPRCYSPTDYLTWVKEQTPFAISLAMTGHDLISTPEVQRFILVEKAKTWPMNQFDLNFELFLKEFMEESLTGSKMIKTTYRQIESDMIFVHDRALDLSGLQPYVYIPILKVPETRVNLNSNLGRVALDYYKEFESDMNPFNKKTKFRRDIFRDLCYKFLDSVSRPGVQEWEGIIISVRDRLVKLINPAWRDYTKNQKLFTEGRV